MDTENMGELLSFQSFYFAFNRTFMHSASPVYVLMLIDSCIHLGWQEMAHDILNDMDAAGDLTGFTQHMALLTAYYSREMFKEAKARYDKWGRLVLL